MKNEQADVMRRLTLDVNTVSWAKDSMERSGV